MNCLSTDRVYLYLEGELPREEIDQIEAHLLACQKCREAFAERRIFMEAVHSLPQLQVPPDFTRQVMDRIFPERSSVRLWIGGLATGFSLVVAIFLAAFLQSGLNFSGTFVALNRTIWKSISSLSVFFVKSIKIVSLGLDLLPKITGYIYTTLRGMSSAVGTEVQVILVTFTLLLLATAFFMVKRKIWMGEKI